MRNPFGAVARAVRQALGPGESGWTTLLGGAPFFSSSNTSASGKLVSQETALSHSAVWACVTRTAQLVATLPAAVYEKRADGGRVRVDDPIADILTRSPNSAQTAVEFWETNTAKTLLNGNGYNERKFVGPRLVGLVPIQNCWPERDRDGKLRYAVYDRGRKSFLPVEKVFHLRGFGIGGDVGMSAIKYGVQSMGAALAADEAAGSLFANGLMGGGVIEADQQLDPGQRAQLQSMLNEFAGSSNVGKIITLESGLKYSALKMNPDDAQLLDTRKFQVEDICRWFGLPPIVIGHSADGQTMWGSGVEQIMLSWLTLGINPLLRRIEARIQKDLMRSNGRNRYFEFNREAMLQMDSKAKGEFLSRMVAGGIMTSDESRAKLNLPARGGPADELRAQVALAPLDQLGNGDRK